IMAFSRSKASSERMEEVLKAPVSINKKEDTLKEDKAGTVRFENVSFRYPGASRYILKDVTFDVAADEKFVIMGGTGSGKSTLLSLIPKMYDVREGKIYVNDKSLEEWEEDDLDRKSTRLNSSHVSISYAVFENLLWG